MTDDIEKEIEENEELLANMEFTNRSADDLNATNRVLKRWLADRKVWDDKCKRCLRHVLLDVIEQQYKRIDKLRAEIRSLMRNNEIALRLALGREKKLEAENKELLKEMKFHKDRCRTNIVPQLMNTITNLEAEIKKLKQKEER